jgi:hypothetical protein
LFLGAVVMKGICLGTFFCLCCGFTLFAGDLISLDSRLKKEIESRIPVKSKYLCNRLASISIKRGGTKKILKIYSAIARCSDEMEIVSDLFNDICSFCEREDISADVLVIMLAYLERISDKLKDFKPSFSWEIRDLLIQSLIGCFVLAYKYYEEVVIWFKDFVPLCRMCPYIMFGDNEVSIKKKLAFSEGLVFQKLDFDAGVSEAEFEKISDEICGYAFDDIQLKQIGNLDSCYLIKGFVRESASILSKSRIGLKNYDFLSRFITKFIDIYSSSDVVFDLLILSLHYLNIVCRFIVAKYNFTDVVFLFIVFRCFMLADSRKKTNWREVFNKIFPKYLLNINVDLLFKQISKLVEQNNGYSRYIESLCDALLLA